MGDLTFLNKFGDVRINWDEEADGDMLPVIQRLMDAGMTFWKLNTVGIGAVSMSVKRKVRKVSAIKDDRILAVRDEDFFKIVAAGLAGVVESDKAEKLEMKERHTSAKQVVKHKGRTVAVQALQGG